MSIAGYVIAVVVGIIFCVAVWNVLRAGDDSYWREKAARKTEKLDLEADEL